MRRGIAFGELVLAVLCGLGAVASWNRGLVTTSFAAAGEMPGFDATRYVAPWLLLATLLLVFAGLFAVDAVSRVRSLSSPN
ncbi:hypothetical protein [Nocardia sp. XZ_19_385]|uniref:hypothetical protein n=1 Tax=Nocardia sp. XZ_19_385 TaxID=2769488 RepID=UPI00188FF554|nr:hypothetical protein [Nocardia sp. XZ_19_385]